MLKERESQRRARRRGRSAKRAPGKQGMRGRECCETRSWRTAPCAWTSGAGENEPCSTKTADADTFQPREVESRVIKLENSALSKPRQLGRKRNQVSIHSPK
jgi:hypothetical protein